MHAAMHAAMHAVTRRGQSLAGVNHSLSGVHGPRQSARQRQSASPALLLAGHWSLVTGHWSLVTSGPLACTVEPCRVAAGCGYGTAGGWAAAVAVADWPCHLRPSSKLEGCRQCAKAPHSRAARPSPAPCVLRTAEPPASSLPEPQTCVAYVAVLASPLAV